MESRGLIVLLKCKDRPIPLLPVLCKILERVLLAIRSADPDGVLRLSA